LPKNQQLNVKIYRYVISIRLSTANTLSANENLVAVGVGPKGFKEIVAKPNNIQLGDVLHTYRVEVQGNIIRLKIDGRTLLSVPDPTFPNGTVVGLADSGCQLQVKSFTVYQL